jgi:proteasome lid subunit RPN8/RPN11
MQLTSEQLDQLVRQAKQDAPNETCGLIGGVNGRAVVIYPLRNVHPNPETEYLGDPAEELRALQDIEDHQLELLAIYHSHPSTGADFSPTDIAKANWPEAIYLVISLANPEQASVRAYTVQDSQAREGTLEIEEGNEPSRANPGRSAKRAGGSGTRRAVAALSKRRPARRESRQRSGRVSKQV